ncbi:MAG: FAD-binding protein [Bacillus subtilis]|nr:FAD-binding protein [Bacillus subtilis]
MAGPEYARMPEAVVKPASAREISEIMKLANRHRVPVTPAEAGRGFPAAPCPSTGASCLPSSG